MARERGSPSRALRRTQVKRARHPDHPRCLSVASRLRRSLSKVKRSRMPDKSKNEQLMLSVTAG